VAVVTEFFAAYAEHDRGRIGAVLAPAISWSIPGHHPLSGTKHGVDEVLAFFDALTAAGMRAETYFLEASDDYVVDIHRGWSTLGEGRVDTDWHSSGTSPTTGESTASSTSAPTSTRWTATSGPTSPSRPSRNDWGTAHPRRDPTVRTVPVTRASCTAQPHDPWGH
jgi:hypothetical protein